MAARREWRLAVGGLAVVDYGDQWRNRERVNRSATSPDVDFDVTERTIRQTTLTGSVAVGLDWAEEQQLQASWLYLRNTEDEASLTVGNNFNFQADSGSQLRNYRIRFEERELEVLQLSGRHKLGGATLDVLDFVPGARNLEDLVFDWYYTDASAETDIPSEVQFSAVDGSTRTPGSSCPRRSARPRRRRIIGSRSCRTTSPATA